MGNSLLLFTSARPLATECDLNRAGYTASRRLAESSLIDLIEHFVPPARVEIVGDMANLEKTGSIG
jgi:hypothetical protein